MSHPSEIEWLTDSRDGFIHSDLFIQHNITRMARRKNEPFWHEEIDYAYKKVFTSMILLKASEDGCNIEDIMILLENIDIFKYLDIGE